MDRRMKPTLAGVVVVLVVAGACGTPTSDVTPGSTIPPQSVLPATAAPSGDVLPSPTEGDSLTEDISLASFANSATIDNPWLPLVPGRKWVFEGAATVDEERISRSVVLWVTDLTKEIAGIETRVIYELDFDDGQLVEAELAFIAQDTEGNVWRLGEYPEVYEDGEFVEAPTWIQGFEDAAAGYAMKADPTLAGPSYAQGWGPAVDWTDRARLFDRLEDICVPAGCFDDVIVNAEFNRDEPGVEQLKYYALGVGNVRVGWTGVLDEEQEVLDLVEFIERIADDEQDRINQEALAIEERAYEESPDVYGQTQPATLGSTGG